MRFYGLLSNAYTAALVGPDGSVDWYPVPRFDSPTVFCRLLDEERGGFFRVAPVRETDEVRQRYLPGTNVLETTFGTPRGGVVVTDYLPVGRPEVRRLVLATTPVAVSLQPAFGYGEANPAYDLTDSGGVFRNPEGNEGLRLDIRGPGSPGAARGRRGQWVLPPGEYELVLRYAAHWVQERLELGDGDLPARETLDREVDFWRQATAGVDQGLERSLLVLKGLTYRTGGGMVAAATTSLPEALGEERQWDYRFVWVRDGCYAAEALLAAGDVVAARRFLEFLFNLVDIHGKPFNYPFYRVDGTASLGERELGWLAGYRGCRPCRVGNAATAQTQLDTEGSVLSVLGRYFDLTGDLAFLRDYWWAVVSIVNWVSRNWATPDAGLWEFRGRAERHVHSGVLCWVALREGSRLAAALGHAGEAAAWDAAAKVVRSEVLREGYSSRLGRFQQGFRQPALDAALLTLPLYGFIDPRDPRFETTLSSIERELVQGPFVFRYAEDEFGTPRHPFLLASCWLARVYLRRGEEEKARAVLEGMSRGATDLGLFGEHFDQERGEPRGNFPQAFVHAAYLHSLLELRAEDPPGV